MSEIIESSNNVVEPVVNVEPQETSEPVIENSVAEPVEEVAKPQQSKEENAKYAAIRREAEKKARDQMISEMYGQSHGIHTYAEYQKALERENRRKTAEERGVDYDVLEELINDDPRVKQASELLTAKEREEKTRNEQIEFLEYFKEKNGRSFDDSKDVIPAEVFKYAESGVPLLVAYKAFGETEALRKELEAMKAKLSADETNKKNAESSTGGINPAVADSDFITKEVFEANKSDQRWVMKNLEKLTKSRPKW